MLMSSTGPAFRNIADCIADEAGEDFDVDDTQGLEVEKDTDGVGSGNVITSIRELFSISPVSLTLDSIDRCLTGLGVQAQSDGQVPLGVARKEAVRANLIPAAPVNNRYNLSEMAFLGMYVDLNWAQNEARQVLQTLVQTDFNPEDIWPDNLDVTQEGMNCKDMHCEYDGDQDLRMYYFNLSDVVKDLFADPVTEGRQYYGFKMDIGV